MRIHQRYPVLQRWIASERLQALVRPQNLAVARFEPTMQHMAGGGVVDLIFSDDDSICVIPLIDVMPSMLLERELTPIMWPAACKAVPREHLEALEPQINPWLQSLAFARQLNREEIRTFAARLPQGLFETARSANWLGAAPYAKLLEVCAPYVYAARFAHGKQVCIGDPNGGTGAALLASVADVRADLQNPEINALACKWFGADVFGDAQRKCDLAICAQGVSGSEANARIIIDECPMGAQPVQVAKAVPTDVMFSFDPEDSSPAYTFGVFAAPDVPVRSRDDGYALVTGGSAGRILLLVRENWQNAPDADVDEARALAERLSAEEFTVRVCGPAAALREGESADMVHVFTLHHADEMLEAVKHYASLGTPIVATAALPRILNDTVGTPYMLMAGFALGDEMAIRDRLDLLALQERHATFTDAEPRQGYAQAIRTLLAHVRIVLVNSPAEEEALRDKYAFAGPVLRTAPLAACATPESIAHLTGDRAFALVHVPIEGRANIPLLARAAAECGIPLIACGPSAEPAVHRTVSEILGPDFIHIARPSEGQLESLYRTAGLFIDLSWMPLGLSRVARAVECGCTVLVSDRSHARSVWPGVAAAAPGNYTAVRESLQRLWTAPETVAAGPAREAFLGVVRAYAQAQHVAGT